MLKERLLWAIVQRNGRGSEWLLTHTIAPSRLGSKTLWIGALMYKDDTGAKWFKDRMKSGEFRYARIRVSEFTP